MLNRKIERILLIQAPRTIYKQAENPRSAPPLSLACLAAVLEDQYEVKILDTLAEGFWNVEDLGGGITRYGLSNEDIDKRILNFGPDVVGISSMFSYQHSNVQKLAARIKMLNKDIIIVTGGDHPTALPGEVLKEGNIDYIILGEGEYSFRSLLKAIENGKNLSEVDGLAYIANDEIKVNPKTSFIPDLDELPFPARHLLPMAKYSEINMSHSVAPVDNSRLPYTPIISSRGCPAACTYCSCSLMWGKRNFRARSAENVLKEIELLVSEGYKEIYFDDDNFAHDKKRAHRILDTMLERKWDLTWSLPNGVALYRLDRSLLKKMKASGCHSLNLPIESGSQRVLKLMKKPLNLKVVPGLIEIMKEFGIYTVGMFMIGTPGETKEDMEKTLELAVDLKKLGLDYVEFFITIPLPGTQIYEECIQKGYTKDIDLSKMNIARGTITTPDFGPQYLEKVRHRAWIQCNFIHNTDFILYPDELVKLEGKLTSLKVRKNGRIFVGGDMPLIEELLREKGYDLTFFTNENEILKRIEKDGPDLLLIEKELSGIQAWNILRTMRKDRRLNGFPIMLVVKENKDLLRGKDIVWYIQEVLDKKEQGVTGEPEH